MIKYKAEKNTKIIISFLIAFVFTIIFTNNVFLENSPFLNQKLWSHLFEKKQPISTPTPTIFLNPTPQITLIIDKIPTPTKQTIVAITPSPTNRPIKFSTPAFTQSLTNSCPIKSKQTYTSIPLNPNKPNKIKFDPATNPETNIALRGYYEVNESKELISRGGDYYGLDPNMPPQISTLFTNHYPKIIKTYRINAWDYGNNRPIPGESATPNYKVHMLGLEATPGEQLVGLKAGQTIDGTHVFLVRYATANYILMTHGPEDEWDEDDDGGYPFYFLDICVDPNLLAAYQRDHAAGRRQLPAIATGQVFGYAKTNEVKIVVRDTFSFMDTRYKEDWWEYGK